MANPKKNHYQPIVLKTCERRSQESDGHPIMTAHYVLVRQARVNIDSIKTGWRNACEDAGLVDLRFHDARHTFANRLRANGVHEWDIRDLLGHTSVRMTSVYTHQTPANLVSRG